MQMKQAIFRRNLLVILIENHNSIEKSDEEKINFKHF